MLKPITFELHYNQEYRDRFVTSWEDQVLWDLISVGETAHGKEAGPIIDNSEVVGWWKVDGL